MIYFFIENTNESVKIGRAKDIERWRNLVPGVSLDFVQPIDRVKRLLRQLAFIRHMQIEELAARMSHVADFDDAQLEAGLGSGV